MRTRDVCLLSLTLFATTIACAETEGEQKLASGQAQELLPSRTLEDWVSYGDAVVVIDVLNEAELPRDASIEQTGEGYIARAVEFRIASTLWSSNRIALPEGVFTSSVSGWFVHDNALTPATFNDAPRFEVGQRYVVSFVDFGNEWAPQGSGAILRLEGDKVLPQEAAGPSAATDLVNLTPDEIIGVLRSTSSSPEVEGLMDLDPVSRYWEVHPESRPTD